jgi:hypothetical protein
MSDYVEERVKLALKMAYRLEHCYKIRSVETANAIDEHIDKSGNLLGWLRDFVLLQQNDKSQDTREHT